MDDLLNLINRWGVHIGASASLAFFMLEAYFNLGKSGARSWFDRIKSAFLLLSALATMAFAFYALNTQFEPVTAASKAANEVISYYDRCRERAETLPPEERAALLRSRLLEANRSDPETVTWHVQLDCLALAMRSVDTGDNQVTQLDWLNQDVALGERLQRVVSISDTLYETLGLDSTNFTGIGQSLPTPGAGESNTSRYSEAEIREYLAPNICVTTTLDAELCPERHPRAWTWILNSMSQADGRTIGEFLRDYAPQDGGGAMEYRQFLDRLEERELESPTDLLIRFQVFPIDYYRGTTGRPEAYQVFYSSLADAIDLTMPEAFRRSGQSDPPGTSAAPNSRVFVWVYEPQTSNEYLLATWGNIYAFLRNMPVDRRLREIAEAEVWPPPEQVAASESP